MEEHIFQHESLIFEQAQGEFETLEEFLHLVAGHLLKEHDNYVKWHDKQQKNSVVLLLDDLNGESYIDSYLEGLSKHGRTFPAILLNSIMIAACSLFETNMRLACGVMNHFKITEIDWNSLRGTIVDKTVKLLNSMAVEIEDKREVMNTIRNYYMIRNCIVHNNGLININSDKLKRYASEQCLLSDVSSEPALELNIKFCEQVCETFIGLFLVLFLHYTSKQTPD